MHELKRHIYANTVDRFVVKKLVRRVFPRCLCLEAEQRRRQLSKVGDKFYNVYFNCINIAIHGRRDDWESYGRHFFRAYELAMVEIIIEFF